MGNTINPNWSIASAPAWRSPTFWSINLLPIALLIVVAAWLRLRKMSTRTNGEMSTKEALQNLIKNKASGPEFDLMAYDCLNRIMSEKKIKELSPLLSQVRNRYDYIKFSGNTEHLEEITKTNQSQIIEELNQLNRECSGQS